MIEKIKKFADISKLLSLISSSKLCCQDHRGFITFTIMKRL